MSELYERPPTADRSLIGRMIRAARLDPQLYAEVEADESSVGQAASVIILSALAGAVNLPGAPLAFLSLELVAALLGWLLFAYAIFLLGVKLLPEPATNANYGALLRALGFANAPGVVKLLGIVPELRTFILVVAWAWVFVATVTAVRHALSYTSSWRAIGVCVLPQLASLLLIFAIGTSIVESPESSPGAAQPPVVSP
jgi:hypothetical protein